MKAKATERCVGSFFLLSRSPPLRRTNLIREDTSLSLLPPLLSYPVIPKGGRRNNYLRLSLFPTQLEIHFWGPPPLLRQISARQKYGKLGKSALQKKMMFGDFHTVSRPQMSLLHPIRKEISHSSRPDNFFSLLLFWGWRIHKTGRGVGAQDFLNYLLTIRAAHTNLSPRGVF